jgi:cobalt-zinc-cadmium efflux system protein
MALVIAYVANRVARRDASETQTFGYKRIELLAALFNGAVLAGIGLMLIIEAVQKFLHPEPVGSYWVIGLALLSIVFNWVSVVLISADAKQNSNIRAAYLHLMTDIMTSIAVLIGGLGMLFFHWYWLDPVVTIIIAVYLIYASWGLIKETASTLMLFTPREVSPKEVEAEVAKLADIANIHHIHLWKLDDHGIYLEAHLDFKEDLPLSKVMPIIDHLEKHLHQTCHITHCTFQSEYDRPDDKSLIVQANHH